MEGLLGPKGHLWRFIAYIVGFCSPTVCMAVEAYSAEEVQPGDGL